MNEEAKTTAPLWKVSYTYVKDFHLRQGAVVIPAKTLAEANDAAHKRLLGIGREGLRLTSTVPY